MAWCYRIYSVHCLFSRKYHGVAALYRSSEIRKALSHSSSTLGRRGQAWNIKRLSLVVLTATRMKLILPTSGRIGHTSIRVVEASNSRAIPPEPTSYHWIRRLSAWKSISLLKFKPTTVMLCYSRAIHCYTSTSSRSLLCNSRKRPDELLLLLLRSWFALSDVSSAPPNGIHSTYTIHFRYNRQYLFPYLYGQLMAWSLAQQIS